MTTFVSVRGLYHRHPLTFTTEESRPELIRQAARRRWFNEMGKGIQGTILEIKWNDARTLAPISALGIGLAGLGKKGTSQPSMFAGLGSIPRLRMAPKTTPPSDDSSSSRKAGD